MRLAEFLPSAIGIGLAVTSVHRCLTRGIVKSLDAGGPSFSVGERTVRFYPSKFELAKQNEAISVVYSRPLDLLGPKPDDFPINPRFTEVNGRQIVDIPVELGTHFYGGGEISAGLCLNNAFFVTWNQDFGYGPTTPNLYQSHPYVMGVCKDGTAFGVIADITFPLRFSMTDTNLRIENWGSFEQFDWRDVNNDNISNPFSVTIFEGKSPLAVVKHLAKLIGCIQLPPKWSIGYHQCRWSYYPDTEALRVAKTFREKKIPCDVIWFDIHYMDGYRIFTFDEKTFPNPRKLNDELHELGFHTVWMIDPGIKQEVGYSVYDECVGKNLAILASKDSTEPALGTVWPGPCVFPDFTLKETDEWWQSLYLKYMTENAIDGVWNDMNEPAAFNSLNRTLNLSSYHRGMGGGAHPKFHNIFGVLMVKSSREGILKANPTKRPFVLSRSSFLGGQRYAATWTGDNSSDWTHLKLSISMICNLGISGQPFSGPDIGGFFGDANAALFSRWIGFGAFLPFSRGHTHERSIAHEPWSFGEKTEHISRVSLLRRYMLLPYYYTLFYKASTSGAPIVRPAFFIDPTNPDLRKEDNAFLVGSKLLVLVNTSETGPMVINPAIQANKQWHALPLDEHLDDDLPLLRIKEGSIIPTQEGRQFVTETPEDAQFKLFVCLDVNGRAKGTLYEDAGDGFAYQSGAYCLINFVAQQNDATITLTVSQSGSLPAKFKFDLVVVNRSETLTPVIEYVK